MSKDVTRIAWITAGFAAASGLALWLLGWAALALLLPALLAIVLAVLRDEMHRLDRRIHESFVQTEAALGLVHAVAPRLPLPQLRGWAMSPDMAGIVFATVMDRRPARVVELGSGASSLVVGYALERLGSGELLSLDHDAEFAAATADNLRRHGLAERVRVVHAPLRPIEIEGETWDWYDPSALADVDVIDVLIVDGPIQANNPRPMVRFPALPVLLDKLAPDGIVLLDDTKRQQESAMVARWIDLYPELEARFQRTEAGTTFIERRAARPR